MKDFFQSIKFKIIICIFALVCGIMIYAAIEGNNIIFSRSIIETVTQPFVSLGKALTDWGERTIDTLANAQHYREENEMLKQKLTEMYGEIIDKNKTDEENKELRSILGIAQDNPEYEFSAACAVVARKANDIFGGFTINRGSRDGIELYDPVFTSTGLVGIVTEISSGYSVVSTILSTDVGIGAMTERSHVVGIIENDTEYSAKGCCLMSYINKDSDIKVGDVVVTSGSSAFPPDLVIGIVREVYSDSNGLALHAVIEPVEDIFKVTSVFVITDFDER